MKKTNINSLLPYLVGARYIGRGKTAICFLLKNGKALKLFLNTDAKEKTFNYFDDITIHFEEISKLKNDTYIVPEELLIKDGKCVAYIHNYINSRMLKNLPLNTNIDSLVNAYDKLTEDTYEISDRNFELYDINGKNILFSRQFNIIDLDGGKFVDRDIQDLFKENMLSLNDTIIRSLFYVRPDYEINFHNFDLNKLYRESIHFEYEKIKELLSEIKKYQSFETNFDYKIKRNKLIYTTYNTYYRY